MKIKRVFITFLCMAMICVLVACSEKPQNNSEHDAYLGQEGMQANNDNLGDNSPNTGHQEPPITVSFDTMSEIKSFFDDTMNSGGDSAETNEIKNITDYHSQSEAGALSDSAASLLLPVANVSGEGIEFGASWRPSTKCLDIIYIIDNVKYRFKYYFDNDAEWNCDEPAALDVQVGPYTVDFELREHPTYEKFFFGGIEIQSAYVAIWALGNEIDSPSFEAFSFVPLSSIGGTDVA